MRRCSTPTSSASRSRPAASSSLVVDYKHKIGFKGTILIEPKPQEPTKHQYDYDVATVYGFLKRFGLEKEVKVNIEQGHAILAGHSFEHELALANALGIFGSIDMNRNDYQSGWDTDQFPNNVPEMALAYYQVLQAGGFKTGGTNFDAKLRRQSLDPQDLLIGHIGGMDCCARGLKAAARMIEDKALSGPLEERYAGWNTAEGQGDAVRQAHAGRDRRARGQEEDRAAAEIRPAGTVWRTSSTATSDAAKPASPARQSRSLRNRLCRNGGNKSVAGSTCLCLQPSRTTAMIRGMETNRTKTNPQSGFDAQVGALLDRIHESASIVDSLMAMPLPGRGRCRAGMGRRRRRAGWSAGLPRRCGPSSSRTNRNGAAPGIQESGRFPELRQQIQFFRSAVGGLRRKIARTPARTPRPTRSRCARRCRPWRRACRPPAGARH